MHARNSGGVRLGNLMLDSHLLGPGLLQLLITASQTPVDNPLDTGGNTCGLSGNFPRDRTLLLSLMSAEVSHS